MTIYDSNNQAVLTVEVSDESYAYNEIMGDNRLHLEFELPTFVEIPVGSYVTFHYETYYLLKPESLRLVHRRYWEYVIEFEGMQEVLKTLVYQNPDDHRVEFPVTGKAQDHLDILVRCINSKSNGWTATADSSLTLDKCINYSFNNCKEALQAIADAFETEWEVVGKAIYVRKVEYNSNDPISMSYGKGNGLRTGIERKNYNDEIPLTTVYVKGDDRNIGQYVGANNQTQTYDGKTLHLPKSATGGYDGSHFSWEQGYSSTGALSFAVSADGYSVYDTEATGRNEGILDCTDIYPKYEGTVTKVVTIDASKNLYDFYDSTANCPNFANLATSETMTVIFQSGQLAGREFDVNCKGSTTYGIHYEIVPVEQDTLPMPGGTFVPSAGTGNNDGDRYIIFHCKLPYQYINDATNHAGAEWDMLKTAVKYLYEARNPRYSITGELDGNWSSSRWSLVGQKIKCGGYISFTDPSFQTDPFLIRIQSVKHFVNKQFKPVITLANTPTKGSVASQIRSIERDNFGNELQINDSRQFTKRTFASAKATMDALAEYFADYSDFIKPVGIQTMQMIAGDERLQLQFSDYSSFSSFKQAPVVWSSGLVCGTGYVRNVNIGDDREIITTISGSHGYHAWVINSNTLTTDALTHTALVDNKQYYLYLRAPKAISQTASQNYAQWELYPVGEDDSVLEFYDGTNYNFLVGILNMMEDETRQFVPIYGFTEITPGGITTDMIRSSQGNSWLNLLSGTFSWGNIADTTSDNFRGMSWNGDTFKIKGDVEITGGSGLENVNGYSNLLQASTYNAFLAGQYVTDQKNLQGQIDGKIQTWYRPSAPTWSSSENAAHVGDLWYNDTTNELWRYNESYSWEKVDNSAAAMALAQSKRQVFSAQPTPPYALNDLWINEGKLYYCTNGRTSGSFDSADWAEALDIDFSDKASVMREWERIHGAANTSGNATMNGSYLLTKTYLKGVSEPAKLTYDNKILTYNASGNDKYALVYSVTGTSGLDAAYNSLKSYLNTYNLYDGDPEWDDGFSEEDLSGRFMAYYKEEKTFELSNVSDFEYLKAALPNGASTQIGGGVVLSQTLAVKDMDGNVKAGMNGSGAYGDIILWSGSANASGITNAKWRVLKNGTQLNGTNGGAMIQLRPEESQINISDSSGTPTIVIDGLTHSINEIFPSVSGTTITLSTLNASGRQDEDGYYYETISSSQASFTTDNPGILEFPKITLTAAILGQESGSVTPTSTQVSLDIDGIVIATAGTATQTASSNTTGVKYYLAAGTHTITLSATFDGQSERGVTFNASVTYEQSSAPLKTDQKVSYLCANGFILGSSSTDYLVSEIKTVNNESKHNFIVRSGNAGITVYDGTIQMTWNSGVTWYSITRDINDGKLTTSIVQ